MKKSLGFTLIELLIVIALLGALAVGLLATIDPFEQLKKAEIRHFAILRQNFITQICVSIRPNLNFLGVRVLPRDQCFRDLHLL